MKKFKTQGGLAALEVVIVAAIVAIFATTTVPKMARLLDKVQLDYEMKRLYSTLELGRSISKSSSCSPSIFEGYKFGDKPLFEVYPAKRLYNLTVNVERNYVSTLSTIYKHRLADGMSITKTFSGNGFKISPSSSGSGTITLTSKFGKTANVTVDSVGRVHGWYEK